MRIALALLLAAMCVLLAQGQTSRDKGGKGGGGGGGGGSVSCTIDSVTPVAFGAYDSDANFAHTSTGGLRFSCKPAGQTVTVRIGIGPSAVSGSIAVRAMRELGGSDRLEYNLFQDQRGTILWGDGINGGIPALVSGSKSFSVEIYGIAQPHQVVSEGIYADTLRITILP